MSAARPAPAEPPAHRRGWLHGAHARRVLRVALSYNVLNGASAALGMFLVSALVHATLGAAAAAHTTVGVITVLATDVVRPRRGKLAHMVVAPLLGVPLYFAVQMLRAHPAALGVLMVAATFVAFLGMAWGKRGIPVAIGVMLAMLFGMSPQAPAGVQQALQNALYCGLGALLYLVYAVLANLALNGRYRTLLIADLLLTVAALLRTHAARVALIAHADPEEADSSGLGELLKRQAALADQLQATRDIVLESPNTPRRQRLAGMLVEVLELRDHLIASELDLDRARRDAHDAAALDELARIYRDMARDLSRLADALMRGREPPPARDHARELAALHERASQAAQAAPQDEAAREHAALVRSVTFRISHQSQAVCRLAALARGEAAPDLAAVRTGWKLFVSPAYWSWQPLLSVWHWRQPALRHALRAALAVGTGYLIALWLPWGSHDYWILLTIVVVMRGSLAQTLERRNARVTGTLLGSLLATGLLALHPSSWLLLLVVTVSQGVLHAFAVQRYAVSAVAASIMGLVQGHLLYTTGSPGFALLERVGDTLLGAGIAWAFSYVLPSWERDQLAGLVRRVVQALGLHAHRSLEVATLDKVEAQPELGWRLARREAYDALSALVQATGRALAEPRAVRPPLPLLELLQGHSYQLLGQLSAVQSLLLLRSEYLPRDAVAQPIRVADERIQAALDLASRGAVPPDDTGPAAPEPSLRAVPEALPDPLEPDASPWLLRRLRIATRLAGEVRHDAEQVLAALDTARAGRPGGSA